MSTGPTRNWATKSGTGGAARFPGPADGADPPVVVVTRDETLGQRLAMLAAAAGVPLRRLHRLPAGWSRTVAAPLVLVDPDTDLGGERRPGVVIVSGPDPGAAVWRRAVESGAEHVVALPDGEPWLLDRLLDAAAPAPASPVLAVIGGRGGAGASTLAVALASVAARSGVACLLVDADPLGGGLDLLLGAEQESGLRWPDLGQARGRLQPGLLTGTLPSRDDVSVLSWARPPAVLDAGPPGRTAPPVGSDGAGAPGGTAEPDPVGTEPDAAATAAVLDAGRREFGLVVVDVGRRLGEPEQAALQACRTVFVVVPAEVRAAAAAAAVCTRLDRWVADQRLVVRGPAPTGLPAEAVADALGLPLAGEVHSEPAVAAALDRGEPLPTRPRGALTVLCRRLLVEALAP